MKIHQQFDLNLDNLVSTFNDIPKTLNEIPLLVEKLVKELLEKGYEVIKEGTHATGVPQTITVAKEFTGPFVTKFSAKMKDDFSAVSKALGIEMLFE